jgi:hypothetical protein
MPKKLLCSLGMCGATKGITNSLAHRVDRMVSFTVTACRSQGVPKLRFQLRNHEATRERKCLSGIRQRAKLPQVALCTWRRRRKRSDQCTAEPKPVHADPSLGTELQSLSRDLRVTVDDNLSDIRDREPLIRFVTTSNDELVPRSADARPTLHHVNGLTLRMLGQQSKRIAITPTLAGKSCLLGQTHRGQRALHAEPLVVRDGRAIDRFAQDSSTVDRSAYLIAKFLIDHNSDRDVVGVIANTPLLDRDAMCLFDQERVCADLDPIGPPGLASSRRATRLAAFVFVRNQHAAARSENIDGASDSELAALELERLDGIALLLCNLDVQPTPGIHRSVRELQPFHLLEIEQALAVRECVKGGDAE